MPNVPVRPSRLPRPRLPAIEAIAEPDGNRYVKIVRTLADAAIVVARSEDEIRFLVEFGRPTGIVAIGKANGGDHELTYRVAGQEHVETWLTGTEAEVRKLFEEFAAFAGRLKTEETP